MHVIYLLLSLCVTIASASRQPRQATRREVVARLASPARRQTLPSAGIYPTCANSPFPLGTPNTVNDAIIANSYVATSFYDEFTVDSLQECIEVCQSDNACATASLSTSQRMCSLSFAATAYVTDPDRTNYTKARSCAQAQVIANTAIEYYY